MTRIDQTFARLNAEGKTGFVAYIMAGDPDRETSQKILDGLPDAGADIIELGMPFTDPMADGAAIQGAALRSLAAGMTLKKTLDMAAEFRKSNDTTPIVVMGYCNPVHHMGYGAFAEAASKAGVDGAIIVDLPPEEDEELRAAFETHDLSLIRLATPTTDDKRLPRVVEGTKGFVYYVSVAGVTGAGIGASSDIASAVSRVKAASGLPVAVGFGIRTPEKAAEIAKDADAVVVGSAIVDAISKAKSNNDAVSDALSLVSTLSDAAKSV